MNIQKYLSLFLFILLCGCGVATTVKLATQIPEKTTFAFKDERPSEQKLSHTDGDSSGKSIYLGDDAITPAAPTLLKSCLQNKLSVELTGRTVSLSDFVVKIFDPSASVNSSSLNAAAASVPNGYAAAPFAGLLIMGIEKVKSDKIVYVEITGKIDTRKFSTIDMDYYSGRVSEENIRSSMTHALDKATSKVQQTIAGM